MRNHRLAALIGSLLVGSFVMPVAADVVIPPPTGAPARRDRREERREDRKEARDDRKEAREDKREDRRDDREERREAGKERREALRESRKERRKERRDEIEKKWGALVKNAAGRAELRVHARRTARLQRVLAVAEEAKDQEAVDKVKKLLAREEERHQKRMTKLAGENKQ